MPLLYRLSPQHTLSIEQLRHALELVVIKHLSLRTALIFDKERNRLIQRIMHLNDDHQYLFSFVESIYETEKQLTEIMYNEKRNSQLFNLVQGLVFRCHLVHYRQISSDGSLCDQDAIIFNFHHALFDIPSLDVFLRDLDEACTTSQLATDDENSLRYLDCNYL